MKKLNDRFVDTVKIHNTAKKYSVYFYAMMRQTILTSLDDLRATVAAYSIFTSMVPPLMQRGGCFCILQSFYPRQQLTGGAVQRRGDLLLDGHQHLPPTHLREASSGRQVGQAAEDEH